MAKTKKTKSRLTKKEPEKRLLLPLKKKAGRGSAGRITIRHRGGGVKRLYRIIDFGQEKMDMPAKVIALEYDPNRTAYIALLEYKDGEKRYRLAPKDLKVGDEVICSEETKIQPGNRIKLKNLLVGTQVYNIEIIPGRGGRLVRGAGTAAIILAKEGKYCHLEMPSGEIRKIPLDSFASIGQISHPRHRFEKIGKAGIRRLRGWRPTVRGSAMSPPDHPHGGGGGGKAPIGLKYPKTPWGKHASGVKTRRRKWTDKYIIQRRKKKKK
ncbi:50S ribosomal protein L2 [Parcubacteria bacterium DG_74_3]|nr:MAG: 50S ribosomal protein L2 [Parcubacteria bacterium DG_74_3]